MWNKSFFILWWGLFCIFCIIPFLLIRSVVLQLLRWVSRMPRLRLPEDRDQFRQEIEGIIPIGSSLVRAKKILKRNGFRISTGEEKGGSR